MSIAKFRLGKITNKYLIAEILALACDSKSEMYIFLHSSNKSLRLLLRENYMWLRQTLDSLTFCDLVRNSNCNIGRSEASFLS